MLKRLLKILLSTALFAYIGFCATVYFCPQLFFYNPSNDVANIQNAHNIGYPAQEVEYQSKDGTELYAWFTKPKTNFPIVVFMHGNSYNIEKFTHKLIPFVREGYGTMLPEYRGFGGIKGTITQQGLEQDAAAAINWLYSQGYKNQDIILYGMSLGSYTAAYTANRLSNEHSFKSLILEVPFDSLYATAKDAVWIPLPLDIIIRDKYDNLSLIKNLKLPIFVMGAEQDKVVPLARAKKLYNAITSPKEIKIYPKAEHSNLYEYNNYQDILDWLEKNEKTRL